MVEDVYSGDDYQRRVDRCAIVHVPLAFHVRADGAAFFQFLYVRPATATPCSVSTRQIDSTRNFRARI